ncbi:hypothetical protein B566_EDAN013744 [Ephemera danica]|nr:hypothetical protein B566_EDAN013744 [Ephemera danica]
MLVLFETSAGYAIFKLMDEKKLQATENLYKDFETPERAGKVVKLKHFEKFKDTTDALAATTAAVEGKMCSALKKMLKKLVVKETQDKLLVADAKLGSAIKDKLSINCMSNSAVQELMRCIRSQLDGLLAGLPNKEMAAMALGLAHSLSRYKLKFSPDKVDTMVVQAISLLDDLDKELNNYVMRCREWYGWHFPEMGKIVADNTAFVKIVKLVGTREKMINSDLSEIIPEELEEQVKEAAEISMGTEISDEDIDNIQLLCDQILDITAYRTQLYDYLHARMMAIAPNLTTLVGELIGARLISHAGSLLNLAKHPASTVQILGAEKALFRALKTHRDTPKYGLIYHAQLASRMLATKASLATRVDALGEDGGCELGIEHKASLTLRLRQLEEGVQRRISGTGKSKVNNEKFHAKSEVKLYHSDMDSTIKPGKVKRPLIEEIGETSFGESSQPPKKKIKKEPKEEPEDEDDIDIPKKKKKKSMPEEQEAETSSGKKKKKKKSLVQEVEEPEAEADVSQTETPKKKKKKKHSQTLLELEEAEEPTIKLESGKKKKKKPLIVELPDEGEEETVPEPSSGKKKKKKKKSFSQDDE